MCVGDSQVSQEAYEEAAGWAERCRVGEREGQQLAYAGSAGVIDDEYLGSPLPRVQGGAEKLGSGQGEGKRVGEGDGDNNALLLGSMAVNSETFSPS